MKSGTVLTLVAVASMALLTTVAQAGEHKFTIQESSEHGSYLADADGRALYIYTADTQGHLGSQAVSNCYDTCADAWPPVYSRWSAAGGR